MMCEIGEVVAKFDDLARFGVGSSQLSVLLSQRGGCSKIEFRSRMRPFPYTFIFRLGEETSDALHKRSLRRKCKAWCVGRSAGSA